MNDIKIRLRDDELQIFAGQYIHGEVYVSQKMETACDSITLGLVGQERVTIQKSDKNGEGHTSDKTTKICNIKFVIAQFAENKACLGQFVYPFKMQVPVWLPESVSHIRENEIVNISYHLEVSYAPFAYQTWTKELYVFNPVRIQAKSNL